MVILAPVRFPEPRCIEAVWREVTTELRLRAAAMDGAAKGPRSIFIRSPLTVNPKRTTVKAMMIHAHRGCTSQLTHSGSWILSRNSRQSARTRDIGPGGGGESP